MSFEDLLRADNPIPSDVASEFFIGLKKVAEWNEGLDLSGTLEGQFCVPVEQVVSKLSTIIAMRYRLMMAYFTYAQSMRGHHWRGAKIEFFDHAEDEKDAIEFYTKRAVALAGPVHIDPVEPPPASTNPLGILKLLGRAEQEMIAAERELRAMVGEENPMRITIEEHMAKNQHHLDEVWQHMSEEEAAAVQTEGLDMSGMEQPMEAGDEPELAASEMAETPEDEAAEEEPEEQEVTAAMLRFDRALKKLAEEDPAAARFNAYIDQVVIPAENRARMAANFVAQGMGQDRFPHALANQRKALGIADFMTAGDHDRSGAMQFNQSAKVPDDWQPKKKEAAARFDAALLKLGFGEDPGEMSAPSTDMLQPTNYLQAELAGQQAQEQNESSYYRRQAQEARMGQQQMQQSVADMQAQLQQLQQQADMAGEQIQQAASEAMAARDDAVNATLEVAKARMGAQLQRQQILELASQDPAQLGEQALGQQMDPMQGMDPNMDPNAQVAPEGPAGQAPTPGVAPNAAPGPGGTAAPSAGPAGPDLAGAQEGTQVKAASSQLVGGLIGAGLAAGGALSQRGKGDEYRTQASQLEQQQDGSFRQALALAAAQKAAIGADLVTKHPGASAVSAGIGGALSGAVTGPAIMNGLSQMKQHIGDIAGRGR